MSTTFQAALLASSALIAFAGVPVSFAQDAAPASVESAEEKKRKAAGQPAAAVTTPDPEIKSDEEVVVTASGFQQRITQAPASISLIPRARIEENRGNALPEILRDVEGVDVGSAVDKSGAQSINIRGMGADYTLILVDGRRQNAAGNVTPNAFNGTAFSFNPPTSAIERVEVVRGPVSTLYGSDAMGGVVNIITRKVGEDWAGTVSLDSTYQLNDEFGHSAGGSFYVSGPLAGDWLGLSLRGSFRNREASELKFVNVNGDETIITGFNGRSATTSRIWQLGGRLNLLLGDDHNLWLDATTTRQWYDNSLGQMGTNTLAGGYADALEFNRDEFVLAHDWTLPFGLLQSTLSHGATETIGRIVPPGVPGAGDPRTLEAINTIFDTQLTVDLERHTFTIGGQYWDAEMTDGVAAEVFEHQQWALFAEDEWRFTDSLALTVGGRYDNHSKFGGQFSPRAYLVWNVNDEVVVKGGVSQGFKTPRLDQIASGIVGFGGQGTIPLLGSPNLKPETSTSYEIGAYYDNGDWFRGSITAFYNQFEDKIAAGVPLVNCAFGLTLAQYQAAQPFGPGCYDAGFFPRSATFGQSVNVDEAETRGVEVNTRFRFAEDWTLSVNYTFTESKQKSGASAGLPLTDTPKHMVNGNLRWNATDDLSLWLRGEYRSKRFRGVGLPRTALGDYKEQTIFSLGGSYAATETVTINLTVYNLFDQDFTNRLPYFSNPPTNTVIAYDDEFAISEEPRRIWLSLSYDF
ncbi:MAG: TonB-dependent receptor [Micropepsaceae bacterium]